MLLVNPGAVRIPTSSKRPKFDISGAVQVPAGLVFSTQPGGAADDVPFTQQPVVEVRDGNNQVITSFNGFLYTDLSMAPFNGTLLSATLTEVSGGVFRIQAVNGAATFTDLRCTPAGAGYVLRVSTVNPPGGSGGVGVDSAEFEVTAP